MLKFLQRLFGAGTPSVNLQELPNAHVIDVRQPEEFAQGHFPGSTNIPLGQLPSTVPQLKSEGRPIVTVCASGNRSGMAQKQLVAAGISAINGGAWNRLAKES